jgi:cellulose synthase/poly-beta-1,6-N-acetylglucosamine synthase-like glycosyltransferase
MTGSGKRSIISGATNSIRAQGHLFDEPTARRRREKQPVPIMNKFRSVLRVSVAAFALAIAGTVFAASPEPVGATSEFREESNGTWLYLDGTKTPAFVGMVYQNTEGDKHIRSYEYGHTLSSLYSGLDDNGDGGQGHGARLEAMGIRAIRVYELPTDDAEDAERVKGIFRRLYARHHIKVLVGDWAGLNTGMDFKNREDVARLRSHLQKLAATYSGEAWVLGWQLGNENNYHTRNGVLGQEIGLNADEYYQLMDDLAGLMKEQLGRLQRRQIVSLGQGDLTDAEAHLIARMKNIDAVGINCYRGDPNDFEQLIKLAGEQVHRPVYFAEIGKPADGPDAEKQQTRYLEDVCSTVLSHGAGALRSGTVIGAFIHEATDESWKKNERGKASDAHYGILGKPTEHDFGQFLTKYNDFSADILPTNDAPDTLIQSAWQCLEGPYAEKYPKAFGHAMAYANRAITLYRDEALKQQAQLIGMKSPPGRAGAPDFWALNTVGTGYFIIVNSWMQLSYNYKGAENPSDPWQRILDLADFSQSQFMPPAYGDTSPTNAAGCVFYARQVYASLHQQFPDAHLRKSNGKYVLLDKVMEARFPELSQPYLPLSWRNLFIFVGAGVGLVLGFALLSRLCALRRSVKSVAVMRPWVRCLFLLALVLNLASLFWFVNWWFHPVRLMYFTVKPALYVLLSVIGTIGVLFYFYIWQLLWNMRRPVPMPAAEGWRVAMVTTRVANEPVDALEPTLERMDSVAYPHDSYLLDEENSSLAKLCCERHNVIHFSRKGIDHYNEPSGRFQARTKGGNLNSWLYEYGQGYDFVTFLDPDHVPRREFLHRVLGYFDNPNVAFVQAPQVFHNQSASWIARGAAEQSYFLYGPIFMGLFGIGACVVNGSHSTFRISELMSLKGEGYAVHDADDILTSIRIHSRRKIGVYVPEVLAEGLAPDTWDEFSKQQRRWAYSMFHIFFHYYLPEQPGMPWRCKLVYLLFTSFYFRAIAFIGLLFLPFASALTGNPPVNANLAGFGLRYLPFFALHCGILLFLGQCYLIPHGSKRGFWYRGGLLWVAMWWDNLCALFKATTTKRVTDRVVAAKWKIRSSSPWRAVRAHALLAMVASGVFLWTVLRSDRRETVWGTLIFLGLIALSQFFIVFKIINTAKERQEASRETSEEPVLRVPRPTIASVYESQLPKT